LSPPCFLLPSQKGSVYGRDVDIPPAAYDETSALAIGATYFGQALDLDNGFLPGLYMITL